MLNLNWIVDGRRVGPAHQLTMDLSRRLHPRCMYGGRAH